MSERTADSLSKPCAAFVGDRLLTRGPLAEVALAVKTAAAHDAAILTFDDATGQVIDLDLRGTADEVIGRLAETAAPEPRGRGRPKLGVIAREITLLPRHWEWLSAQPGGASVTLRKLVDGARREDGERGRARAAREAAYHFLSAMAGDLPGFEDAIRALFAADPARFEAQMAEWPTDISDYALRLASGAGETRDGAAR